MRGQTDLGYLGLPDHRAAPVSFPFHRYHAEKSDLVRVLAVSRIHIRKYLCFNIYTCKPNDFLRINMPSKTLGTLSYLYNYFFIYLRL